MATKDAIKFENFKISREKNVNINAGLIIIIIAMVIFSLPLLNLLNIFSNNFRFEAFPTTFGEVEVLLEYTGIFYGFDILDGFNILFYAATGWGVGGFFAAIIYGEEGKSGPLYASYILLRFFVGLTSVLFPAFLFAINSFAIPLTIGISMVILIISLPMILVSSITYRIGLWFSP